MFKRFLKNYTIRVQWIIQFVILNLLVSFIFRLSFISLEEGSYRYIELKVSIGELGEIYEDGTQKVVYKLNNIAVFFETI